MLLIVVIVGGVEEHSNRLWEGMILSMIGEKLSGSSPGEVCGAVVSVRHQEDIIALWNRDASCDQIKELLGEKMKEVNWIGN